MHKLKYTYVYSKGPAKAVEIHELIKANSNTFYIEPLPGLKMFPKGLRKGVVK